MENFAERYPVLCAQLKEATQNNDYKQVEQTLDAIEDEIPPDKIPAGDKERLDKLRQNVVNVRQERSTTASSLIFLFKQILILFRHNEF